MQENKIFLKCDPKMNLCQHYEPIVRQLSLLKCNQIPSPAKISQERHRKAVAAEIVEQTKNQYQIQGVFAEFTIVDCSKNEYLNEF